MTNVDLRSVVGRAPEQLTLDQRFALAGRVAAFEIYTPDTLPLRRIEAVADSAAGCVQMLQERGLSPTQFEFTMLKAPF
jgi:hypothetical protein